MGYVNRIKHYVIYASENNHPSQFTAVINTKNNMIMIAQISRCQNGNSSIVLNSNGPTAYYCIDLGKYFNNIDLNFDAKIGEFVINACDSGVEYTMFLDKKYHSYKDMVTAFNKEPDNDNNETSEDTNIDSNNMESILQNKDNTHHALIYDTFGNIIGSLIINWENTSLNNNKLTIKINSTLTNETDFITFYMTSKELKHYLPFNACNITFEYTNDQLTDIKIYPVDTITSAEIKGNDFSTSVSEVNNVRYVTGIKNVKIWLMK